MVRDLEQQWLVLDEGSAGLSPSFTVRGDDVVHLDSRGMIWGGNVFVGRNSASGLPFSAAPGSFPVPGAPEFGVIARFAGGFFHAGRSFEAVINGADQPVTVRTNDDVPGNGDHQFLVRVQRFRE